MSPASLLPQDVVVLAKLLTYADRRPSLARIAADLFLSGSQVHAALKRLEAARLVFKDAQSSRPNTSDRRAARTLRLQRRPERSTAHEQTAGARASGLQGCSEWSTEHERGGGVPRPRCKVHVSSNPGRRHPGDAYLVRRAAVEPSHLRRARSPARVAVREGRAPRCLARTAVQDRTAGRASGSAPPRAAGPPGRIAGRPRPREEPCRARDHEARAGTSSWMKIPTCSCWKQRPAPWSRCSVKSCSSAGV